MIRGCEQIVDALKAYNPDLYIECSAKRTVSERFVMTTGGVAHVSKRTHWGMGSYVQRTTGTDMLFAGYGRGWCDLNEFYDPGFIAEKIITELRRAEKTAKPPAGRPKVFVPPEILARLLTVLFMGTNGRNVAKGDSPLRDRLGEQVLTDALTIVDDPHRDYSSHAREIDNNGIPTQKQTLFEGGVLGQFLYDLDSAGLAGTRPTGNNGCSPYAPAVLPGPRPGSELLSQIDVGLYVRDLIGFGQSNIMNGDFSANVGLGYLIDKGELAGRVKNTMIAGNLYDILKRNVLLSSDTEYEGRYPHAVIEGVSVHAR
jgi:PmbA protein